MKSERIQVRLDMLTKSNLAKRARTDRRTVSEMARLLIEDGLKKGGKWITKS